MTTNKYIKNNGVRKHYFAKTLVKIYSDKNHQRMLNPERAGLMRNRIINMVSEFLFTNYPPITKGKTVTIQWRNWTSYSSHQN